MIEEQLKPLMKYVEPYGAKKKRVAEVIINRFGEVWIELAGEDPHPVKDSALNFEYFDRLARLLSNQNEITNFGDKPILKVTIPGGHRLTLGIGKFIKSGIAVSIRVANGRRFTLDDFGMTLEQLAAVHHAIEHRANILISGGTFSGKTQFMNAMMQLLDPRDRVLSGEDVDELDMSRCANRVEFLLNQQATALNINYADIIDMMTRMRPDRIVVGELSISNTWTLLRLLNSGHGGLITTVHADSPDLAFRAIERNVQLAGYSTNGVNGYFKEMIDLVIQIKRRPNSHIREVSEVIDYRGSNNTLRAAE
jgi:type IV secretory pathway ATPase VirB11/archaellum biosynthesis ATPase